MVSVLVAHDPDADLRDVVKTAREFVRSAYPDLDDAEWRARPPLPRSIVTADDLYQTPAFTVFEWEGDS